jgi:phosphate:Na+ symporter
MNPGTLVLVNLLGGVALLLWGVRMVRTGITRAWGESLKQFLAHRLGNRLSAFIAGTAATTVLGSGTATSLIVSNIAAASGLSVALGFAVILGADVGSAIVTTLFASGSGFLKQASPLLVFAGYVVFAFSREARPHNFGRVLIGIGLMLLALGLISQATQPLNSASLFHDVLSALSKETLLGFIVGALMAWAFHSTLAAILVIGSLVTNNSLDVPSAAIMVLGVNLGGCMPALLGSLGLPPHARQLPVANLLCRGVLCIAALPFVKYATPAFSYFGIAGLAAALAIHLGINLLVGIVWLPLTNVAERLSAVVMRQAKLPPDPLATPRYLALNALDTPAVALANAAMETGRMSEVLAHMLTTAMDALKDDSVEALKDLRPQDERLNAYQTAIQSYLYDLTDKNLNAEHMRHATEMVLYVSNLEHAGDVIQLSLADRIKAKIREDHAFTLEEKSSIDALCSMLHENIRMATSVLSTRDVDGAQNLIAQKDTFRSLENTIIRQQVNRRGQGRGKPLRHGALFIDLIRDLHNINSYIVSVGYPIVDGAGLLRESRLRKKVQT